MSVEIRTIGPGEVATWVDAMRAGFLEGAAPSSAEAEFRTTHFDLDHTWAAVDGPRIVGTLRSFDTTVAVPGGVEVTAAALTHVTVSATHRRQGLLSEMITADLAACAVRGDAVGVLIAAEYPIYGRFGYGNAAESVELVVDTRALSVPGPGDGSVELVDRDTFATVARDLYDRFRLGQPGAIQRPAWWWDVTLGVVEIEGKKPSTFLAIGRDAHGQPDGFLRYGHTENWENNRPRDHLAVHDLVGLDPTASRRLWRYCLGIDWVATMVVVNHTVGDPIRWSLSDPRAITERDRTDLLWVRILDVPQALSGRRYLTTGRVVLEVEDPMGLSAGRFALEGGPEGATCAATGDPPDLALSISTLSSAYLGGYTLADLARGGRVQERCPGALTRADAMFRSSTPPWSATDF